MNVPGAAQVSPLSEPDPLPGPPWAAHYTLENPWPLAVVLVAIGVLVGYRLQQRGSLRAGVIAAMLGFALGAGAWLLAGRVETDRERLITETQRLIAAGLAADAGTIDTMLRPDITLGLLGRRTEHNKDSLVRLVREDVAARYRAKDAGIVWVRSTVDGPGVGRSQVKVVVVAPEFEMPVPTVWMLHWTLVGDAWRVRTIEAEKIGFAQPGTVSTPN